MDPETETSLPAVGISGGEGGAKTTYTHKTIKLSKINGGWERGRGGSDGRSCHQGRGGRGGRFNHQSYTSSDLYFKGEVNCFCMFLVTTSEQIESKYQYKKFVNSLNNYVHRDFQNPE